MTCFNRFRIISFRGGKYRNWVPGGYTKLSGGLHKRPFSSKKEAGGASFQ